MPVDPDPDSLAEILAGIPAGEPIVMLNLLRFRERARYANGEADYDGRQAYRLYSQVAIGKVEAVGGALVWSGAAIAGVIAPADERWDEVLLVRYPAIEAFGDMLADPAYREATRHRTAALADARLIANIAHAG